MAEDFVIEMLHITKEFPGIKANDDITLQLRKGEVHALLGENGAGKSTLMSVLFGLYQPEAGQIRKNGKEVVIRNPNDANALGIGMVHQHFKLVECFSVLDNIILGVEPNKMGFLQKAEARKKVMALSEKYGLRVDPDALISDISVGMQQRVEILKMLYRDNEILIFDEPTAVLTPQEIDELMEIMRNLAAEGKSILFISHKLNEIMAVADRCTVLRKGKYIGTVETKNTTAEELSAMMVGRNVSFHVDKKPCQPGDVVLDVEHMTVASKIHKNNAVKDVSLKVRRGEIVGIAGVDGNGQTELVDAILGMLRVSGGKVEKSGKDLTNRPAPQIRSDGVALIPPDRQKQGLVLNSSILMNGVLGCEQDKRFCKRGIIRKGQLMGVMPSVLQDYDVRMPSINANAAELSGGNQQKVILAREFGIRKADLVIAVNPTRGLDVGAIEFVYKRIEEQKQAGKAVLLISTELTEIMRLSDRIAVFYKGRCMDILPRETAEINRIGSLMMGITEGGEHA